MSASRVFNPLAEHIVRLVENAGYIRRANMMRRLTSYHRAAAGSQDQRDQAEWLRWSDLGEWCQMPPTERENVLSRLRGYQS
jgi:hypothetical protein